MRIIHFLLFWFYFENIVLITLAAIENLKIKGYKNIKPIITKQDAFKDEELAELTKRFRQKNVHSKQSYHKSS